MTTDSNDTPRTDPDETPQTDSNDDSMPKPEYRCVEFETEDGTATIVQDADNVSAWVQSTLTVPVTR